MSSLCCPLATERPCATPSYPARSIQSYGKVLLTSWVTGCGWHLKLEQTGVSIWRYGTQNGARDTQLAPIALFAAPNFSAADWKRFLTCIWARIRTLACQFGGVDDHAHNNNVQRHCTHPREC